MIAAVLLYIFFLKDKNVFNIDKKPEVRRLTGFPTNIYTEKVFEKKREVIKSSEELAKFLNSIDDTGALILKDPVDFDKEFLLGVSSKNYEETGHEVRIKKLYEDKEKNILLVSVKEIEPGETCEIEPSRYISIDIVAISKTEKVIDFERVKETQECN